MPRLDHVHQHIRFHITGFSQQHLAGNLSLCNAIETKDISHDLVWMGKGVAPALARRAQESRYPFGVILYFLLGSEQRIAIEIHPIILAV